MHTYAYIYIYVCVCVFTHIRRTQPSWLVVLFLSVPYTGSTYQAGSRFQALQNRTFGLEASLYCPRPFVPVTFLHI